MSDFSYSMLKISEINRDDYGNAVSVCIEDTEDNTVDRITAESLNVLIDLGLFIDGVIPDGDNDFVLYVPKNIEEELLMRGMIDGYPIYTDDYDGYKYVLVDGKVTLLHVPEESEVIYIKPFVQSVHKNFLNDVSSIRIKVKGGCGLTSMSKMFEYSNAKYIDLSEMNTSNVESMINLFHDSRNLKGVNFGFIDTSKVKNMMGMFSSCLSLEYVDINSLDTSNVEIMDSMFETCIVLHEICLDKIDTGNVTSFSKMFCNCEKLELVDVSNFNTSNAIAMRQMFHRCIRLRNLDLRNFDTSNVIDMSEMFGMCSALENIDLSSFNTSEVKQMQGMFTSCYNIHDLDLSGFDTSSVVSINSMFSNSTFNNLDISSFDMSGIKSVSSMFENCSVSFDFKQCDFNMPLVENIENMFNRFKCKKILDFSNANFSSVKYMRYAFSDMIGFDDNEGYLDLSHIKARNVVDMGLCFTNSPFKKIDISGITSKYVEVLSNAFANCNNLEEIVLGNFDFRQVRNMNEMCYNCTSLKSFIIGREINYDGFDKKDLMRILCKYTFNNCSSLEKVDLKNLHFVSAGGFANTEGMFRFCYNLELYNIKFDNFFKDPNAYDVAFNCSMFDRCSKIDINNLKK